LTTRYAWKSAAVPLVVAAVATGVCFAGAVAALTIGISKR
jgi:hypothetical protein